MKNLFIVRKTGFILFCASLIAICLYIIADRYVDATFAANNEVREIFEKGVAALLFISFAIGIYVMLRTVRRVDLKAQEHDQKYKMYINNSPDPILVCDKTGRIIETNPAMQKISGYADAELSMMTLQQMWADESVKQGYAALAKMLTTDSLDVTLKYIRKNKADYFLSCHAVRVGEDRFLVMCRDMTSYVIMDSHINQIHSELKSKVEEELKKRHRQEQAIETQKKMADMSKLLSAIAHQWRQPLNILSLYNIDLEDTFRRGKLDAAYVEKHHEDVAATIQKMSGIIDDFRLFFAPEKTNSVFCVTSEIIDVLSILQAQLNYLGIDIELGCVCNNRQITCKNVTTCPDCTYNSAFVRGEQGSFRHVMLNIIYNSIDAIQEKSAGMVGHKGLITISVSCNGDTVGITVSDNGCGVADDILDKVFEPYFTTKDEGKGTGIGLFMSRMVIKEQMHGDIELKNTGRGASAVITLPASEQIIAPAPL
jgi:PAS domain S-box-containing protein